MQIVKKSYEKLKNWLFPRKDIEAPSRELIEAYGRIIQKKTPNIMLPYTVAIFSMTAAASFFALSAMAFRTVLLIPPLLILASNALIIKKDRLFWLGPILFVLSLGNFGMTAGTLLLFFPNPDSILCCVTYYGFLIIFFGGIIFCYRKSYQSFEKIVMRRAAGLAQPFKPYGLFSGVLSAAFAVIVVKSLSYYIIGVGVIVLISYYLCPVIAEQIVMVRQYGEMPKNDG